MTDHMEKHWKAWLGMCVLGGLLLRVHAVSPFLFDSDSYFFMMMAHNLRDHGLFSGTLGVGGDLFFPSSNFVYKWLYAVIMAPLTALMHPEVAGVTVSVASGTLFIPVMFLVGRRLGGVQVGLPAALLAACAYSNVTWSGHVLAESLCTLVVALGIWQAVTRRTSWTGALLGGFFLGAAMTARQEMGLLMPAGIACVVLGGWAEQQGALRRGLRAVLFAAGAAAVVAPIWCVGWQSSARGNKVLRGLAPDAPAHEVGPAGSAGKNQQAPDSVRDARAKPDPVAGKGLLARLKHATFGRVLQAPLDCACVGRFCVQELPAVLLLLAGMALAVATGSWRLPPSGDPRRAFMLFAAWHIAVCALVYNLFVNETPRYYTQLLPSLIPCGALAVRRLVALRGHARAWARAAATSALLAIAAAAAMQVAWLCAKEKPRPGVEREIGLALRRLRSQGTLPPGTVVVTQNRFAVHALSGLPATGYLRNSKGNRPVAAMAVVSRFDHLLVVITGHLRNTDATPSVLRQHFAPRGCMVYRFECPVVLDPLYAREGYRYLGDTSVECYLLTRAQALELRDLLRPGDDAQSRGKA